MNYVLAVLGLGVMILVHEFGHFILAKINGVKVLNFSIGFGPKIITHKGKETEYAISLLPVGGYVEMYGMVEDEEGEEGKVEETEKEIERKFISKSPLQRLSIIIAGPLMNILLAVLIFSVFYINYGYSDTSFKEISQNSAAMEAGLQAGDKVTEINGSKVFTSDDISLEISSVEDKPIDLQFERDGQLMEVTVTPKYNEEYQAYQIGVLFNAVENPSFLQAAKHSLDETCTLIKQNYKAIATLVKGQGNFKTDVGGPVSIVKISSGAAKAGIWPLVRLIAIMSIGIGIFNLLPLPVLDGGTSILILIELITRRKVPTKVVNVLNTVGVVFLFGLMLIVTLKDILFPVNF